MNRDVVTAAMRDAARVTSGTRAADRRAAGIRVERISARERRIIFGPGVYWNVVLRAVHDALFGEPRADDLVRYHFEEGALFLSVSTDLPALRTGIWPKNPELGGTA